jgi:hypothetical protein
MADTNDTPTDLREAVEAELERLTEEAAAEERERIAERLDETDDDRP